MAGGASISSLGSLRKIMRTFGVRERLEDVWHVGEPLDVAVQVSPTLFTMFVLVRSVDEGLKADSPQPKLSHDETLVLPDRAISAAALR